MEQLKSEKPIGAKGGVINTSLSRCFGCELVFEDILGRINDLMARLPHIIITKYIAPVKDTVDMIWKRHLASSDDSNLGHFEPIRGVLHWR